MTAMAQRAKISPPEPPLADGAVLLRPFDERDLSTFEQAATDPEVVTAFGSAPAEEALAFHSRRWQARAQRAKISPPEPPLADGAVLLRPFDERDLATFEQAATDPEVVTAFGSAPAGEALAFHSRRWQARTAAAFAICPGGLGSVGG